MTKRYIQPSSHVQKTQYDNFPPSIKSSSSLSSFSFSSSSSPNRHSSLSHQQDKRSEKREVDMTTTSEKSKQQQQEHREEKKGKKVTFLDERRGLTDREVKFIAGRFERAERAEDEKKKEEKEKGKKKKEEEEKEERKREREKMKKTQYYTTVERKPDWVVEGRKPAFFLVPRDEVVRRDCREYEQRQRQQQQQQQQQQLAPRSGSVRYRDLDNRRTKFSSSRQLMDNEKSNGGGFASSIGLGLLPDVMAATKAITSRSGNTCCCSRRCRCIIVESRTRVVCEIQETRFAGSERGGCRGSRPMFIVEERRPRSSHF